MEEKFIDARGLACPLPVVNAKQASEEMTGDGQVTILVDNEIAVQNLQKFANQRHFDLSAKQNGPKEYEVKIDVKKDSIKADSTEKEEEIECAPDERKKGLVVVLSANTVGSGNDDLGKILMKSFVFSLTKQDNLPEHIICYNSGAFLTTENSPVLEDLKLLESEGVQITTCGTCLDFYNLKEKLQVGSVSNMYEIVELMENAANIIKP